MRAILATALLALAPAVALAQATVDGTWMVVNADKSLDPGSLVTFRVERDTVAMSAVSGISYKARVNGTDAKVTGDENSTSVSVTMPRKNVLVEVSKRNGKPWLSMRMDVDPDGKTAKVTWRNLNSGKSGGHVMAKQ